MIFRKKKYYYNPVTLTFDEIRQDKKYYLTRYTIITCILFAFITASGYFLNYYLFAPETIFLEKKVNLLTNEFDKLLDQSKAYESILKSTYFTDDNLYRIILGLDTLPLSIRYGGTGGASHDVSSAFRADISYQLEKQINKLDIQLQIQRNSFTTVFSKAVEHADRLKRLPAIHPVSKKNLLYISSYFGTRADPFNHANEQIHSGIDFVAPLGSNVYATADGTVTLSRISRTGYGNEIIINHSFGYSTRYAHLHEILVKTGDQVKRGQLIGKLGSSGRSTGPHLHYEVRFENKAINPISYFEHNLSANEYEEIVAQANNGNY